MIGGVHGGNDEHAQLLKRTHVLALDEFVEKTRGDGPLVGVQPVENRLLRFEVVVEPALGQSQVVQDVLDGRLLIALFSEEPAGGIEDSSFGVSGMHIVRHADGLPFVHVPVKHTDRRSVCQMIEEVTPAMRLNIRGKAGRRRPVRRRVQVQCEQALVFNGLNHVHVIATINSHHGFSVMEYSQYFHIS